MHQQMYSVVEPVSRGLYQCVGQLLEIGTDNRPPVVIRVVLKILKNHGSSNKSKTQLQYNQSTCVFNFCTLQISQWGEFQSSSSEVVSAEPELVSFWNKKQTLSYFAQRLTYQLSFHLHATVHRGRQGENQTHFKVLIKFSNWARNTQNQRPPSTNPLHTQVDCCKTIHVSHAQL